MTRKEMSRARKVPHIQPSKSNLTITTIPAVLKLFSDLKIPDYSDVQEGWLPIATMWSYLQRKINACYV